MDIKKINNEPVFWVDLTRVIASFLVVMIHVIEHVVNNWHQYPPMIQNIANVYDSATRMSVPLFFMLSGWLLLPKRESLLNFYIKRFVKVFIPFLVWSGFYLVFMCGVTLAGCSKVWISRLVFLHGTYSHLWFLYFLVGIYLVIPLLRLLVVPDGRPLLWYVIGLWVFFEPVLSLAEKFLDIKTNIPVPLATGFVGFVILGYLLGELRISRGYFYSAIIGWVAGTFFTFISTYYLNKGTAEFDYFFYWYLRLNVIVSSASGFIIIRWMADHPMFSASHFQKIIKSLSVTSFGIYLVHPFILAVLSNQNPFVRINTDIGNPIWSIPVVTLLVFFLSFVAIFVMQKIPLLRKIVP